MSKIVIALGGNALGNSAKEQLQKAYVAANSIVDLIELGHQVVIAHGNGPQVGQIKLAFDNLSEGTLEETIPFAECTAMSQGYIGYHLQQALENELCNRGINKVPVVTMLTQVQVDPKDTAFLNPTKPIGRYYDESTAKKLSSETGCVYKEDSGRGWRRVIASPKPIDICEKESLNALVNAGHLVIACGGGGIPVVKTPHDLEGVNAVIDKDFAAEKMAELIDADLFIVLTAVEHVYVNFNTDNQKKLEEVTVTQMSQYIEENQFAPGSMLPKVEAACQFANSREGRVSIISLLELAINAIEGTSGTRIIK